MVILDNGTTAMTGHQPNPGVDRDAMGQEGYNRISIENVVKGLGVESVTVIKPYKVQKSVDAIKEALAYQGVSVIIAQELCPLYAKALKRPAKKPFRIDMEKCKDHRLCVDALGCPAMYVENNKVAINAEQCIRLRGLRPGLPGTRNRSHQGLMNYKGAPFDNRRFPS